MYKFFPLTPTRVLFLNVLPQSPKMDRPGEIGSTPHKYF